MTKYRVLVLTDHRGHSAENSIYALLQQMRQHPSCAHLAVASRGASANTAFFENPIDTPLFAATVTADFAYSEDGQLMRAGEQEVDPQDFDVVFLRLPRPVTDEYLLQLEQLFERQVIINRPSGIIETSSKAFLLELGEVCPPMRLVRSVDDVLAFAEEFPIVLKPLRGYGGAGVLKVNGNKLDDGNAVHDTREYLQQLTQELEEDGMLAMQFLKNVSQGDKRTIVVAGEIMASSLRMPATDSWLCNVAQGGTSVPAVATEEEVEMIATIHPKLEAAGILIYGVDTLVNDDGKRVLSEVNTLSIGGFPQSERQQGRPIISPTIDKIFRYADQHFAG